MTIGNRFRTLVLHSKKLSKLYFLQNKNSQQQQELHEILLKIKLERNRLAQESTLVSETTSDIRKLII